MDTYRFRSIDNLLGEHRELEQQSIYFAGPDELNDPTDGYRDIIWRGDTIVWSNLFKNYIYCMNNIYYKYIVLPSNGESTLETADIPIEGKWESPITPEQDAIFQTICQAAFKHLGLADAAQELHNLNAEVRRDHLQAYLDWLYRDLLGLLRGVYEYYSASTHDTTLPPFDPHNVQFPNHETLPLPQLIHQLHTDPQQTGVDPTGLLNFAISRSLNHRYSVRAELGEEVDELAEKVSFGINRDYLDNLPKLAIPEWSTACFTTSQNTSTMWSNYADEHKGVCLVFQSHNAADPKRSPYMPLFSTLELAQQASGADLTNCDIEHLNSPLHKVRYATSQDKVNFFTSLAASDPPELMRRWYKDDDNKRSTCSEHINEDGFDETWQENYYKDFINGILSKNGVWAQESEYRLIALQPDANYFEGRSKTLHYRFDDLKGIIFGMRTSDDDKIELAKIVRLKCHKHDRNDFHFRQAHYSGGQIKSRPIEFDWQAV